MASTSRRHQQHPHLGSVVPANVGVYAVIVSNTLGSITSTGAVLSLVSVTAGRHPFQPVVLYRWRFRGVSIKPAGAER